MKLAVIVLLSVIGLGRADIPEEMKQILMEAHNFCTGETGVSDDLIVQAKAGTFTDDPKLKCFFKCMLQRLQVMKDDGSFDLELLEATLPPKLAEMGAMEAVKACNPSPGADICQAAFDALKCINEKNPELSKVFE